MFICRSPLNLLHVYLTNSLIFRLSNYTTLILRLLILQPVWTGVGKTAFESNLLSQLQLFDSIPFYHFKNTLGDYMHVCVYIWVRFVFIFVLSSCCVDCCNQGISGKESLLSNAPRRMNESHLYTKTNSGART